MPPDADASEADPRFPSGRWAGWWEQSGRRATMQLHLSFSRGRIFGEGRDSIGDFTMNGSYNTASGAADLLKTYLGGHDVDYEGASAERSIRGIWRIMDGEGVLVDGGPFQIWPTKGPGIAPSVEAETAVPTTNRP